MVVTGVLNNTVKGIIARASVTSSSGCAPFSSNLSLNISGSAMVYDWQSSEDSLSWANIIGATGVKISLLEGTDDDNTVFSVSPNPTTGAINLTTDVAGKVVIYTIDGKQLQHCEAKAGTTSISLPTSLASGVYMLRFTGANGSNKIVRLVYQP
eukprot:gene23876-32270_t